MKEKFKTTQYTILPDNTNKHIALETKRNK